MKINGSHVLITHPTGEQTIFDMNDVQKGRFHPSGDRERRGPRLVLEFKSATALVLDGDWVKDLWETIKNRAGAILSPCWPARIPNAAKGSTCSSPVAGCRTPA